MNYTDKKGTTALIKTLIFTSIFFACQSILAETITCTPQLEVVQQYTKEKGWTVETYSGEDNSNMVWQLRRNYKEENFKLFTKPENIKEYLKSEAECKKGYLGAYIKCESLIPMPFYYHELRDTFIINAVNKSNMYITISGSCEVIPPRKK